MSLLLYLYTYTHIYVYFLFITIIKLDEKDDDVNSVYKDKY